MKTMIPRTYEDAKTQGYSIAFLRYQRGYISRNTNIDKAPVMVAGGTRKGMLYVLVPCWQSTQYCRGCISQSDKGPGGAARAISCTWV